MTQRIRSARKGGREEKCKTNTMVYLIVTEWHVFGILKENRGLLRRRGQNVAVWRNVDGYICRITQHQEMLEQTSGAWSPL